MNNKILFVNAALYNSKYSYAGLEKMFGWVANALAEEGIDVSICTFYDKERNPNFSSNVKSICFGFEYNEHFIPRTIGLFTSIRRKLINVLREYDTVVNFGDISFFVLMTLRLRKKFRLVTSERGDPYNKETWLSKQKLKLYRNVDCLVFQTYGAQEFFSEVIKSKSYVIPNAIAIPVLQWNGSKIHNHIANVGRVDFWQKRPDVLLKAFKIVLGSHPDIVLDIYGDGELSRLQSLSYELGIQENVIVHGVTRNVNEKLLEADIFVITSDFEGIPNALLEAMALGMPVVSTDCSPGGASMLIDNKVNGLLVEKGNVEQVASAINFLIENHDIAIDYAAKARIKMKEYEPQQIVKQWREAICPK